MALDMQNIQALVDDFFDRRMAVLALRQKMLIAGAIMLLPCVAFFFLVYSPMNEKINGLETKKAQIEGEIRKVEKTVSELGKHRAEMAEVKRLFAEASLLLPDQKEIPSLLAAVSGQAAASGLDVVSFKPMMEKPQEFYAEIPVDVVVNGAYHSVGVFLDKLSKFSRVVAVGNMKLDSPKQMVNEVALTSTFHLVTYRFLDEAEIAAQKKKAAPAKK